MFRFSIFRPLLAILCLYFLTGCISASGGIATSNLPMEGRQYEVLGPAETTVSWWTIDLGIIGLPLSDPPVSEAESRLVNQNEGDALINLRYWTDRSMILFIINRHRFHLKADVVRFTDGRGNLLPHTVQHGLVRVHLQPWLVHNALRTRCVHECVECLIAKAEPRGDTCDHEAECSATNGVHEQLRQL